MQCGLLQTKRQLLLTAVEGRVQAEAPGRTRQAAAMQYGLLQTNLV